MIGPHAQGFFRLFGQFVVDTGQDQYDLVVVDGFERGIIIGFNLPDKFRC